MVSNLRESKLFIMGIAVYNGYLELLKRMNRVDSVVQGPNDTDSVTSNVPSSDSSGNSVMNPSLAEPEHGMNPIEIIGFIFILILLVIFLVWITIYTVNNIRKNNENPPTNVIPSTNQCTRSTNNLIDITDINCCCQAGFPSNRKYVVELNAVVGPTPVDYLSACSGFCQDGKYNSSSETCVNGPSDQFTACIQVSKPVNCKGPAMPVAVIGTQLYYIQSATQAGCTTTGNCTSGLNTCSVTGNASIDTRVLFNPDIIPNR